MGNDCISVGAPVSSLNEFFIIWQLLNNKGKFSMIYCLRYEENQRDFKRLFAL